MAVRKLSPGELARIAACASLAPTLIAPADDRLGFIARRLALISEANANALDHNQDRAVRTRGVSADTIQSVAAGITSHLEMNPKLCHTAANDARTISANTQVGPANYLPRALAVWAAQVAEAADRFSRSNDPVAELDEDEAVLQRTGSRPGNAFTIPGEGGRGPIQVTTTLEDFSRPAGSLRRYTPPPPVTRVVKGYKGAETIEETYDRKTTVNRIKKALRARTGRSWAVRTSDTWQDSVDIKAPAERQVCDREGYRVSTPRHLGFDPYHPEHGERTYRSIRENADGSVPGMDRMCRDDRALLAAAMREPDVQKQGSYHCYGSNCSEVSVALAEGRTPTVAVRRYEYD